MNTEELPENSDSSDEDYVPEGKTEVLSEVESDGDTEDDLVTDETEGNPKKRTKGSAKRRKKQKTAKNIEESPPENPNPVTEEEKKKKDDDIWADFMRDTGFQSKGKVSKPLESKSAPPPKKPEENKPKTVTVTQVFEFAGEEVTVQKQVTEDSPTSYLNQFSSSKPTKTSKGIGGILSQLGKKPKITTLEKSKLDWDQFKREENIEEELQTHNKGRDGYLEKQDFLNRADLRRFEIEKKIRTNERAKRVNNAL